MTKSTIIQIRNKTGVSCNLSAYGARILGIRVPLTAGERELVVSLVNKRERERNPYFGAIVGRVAGRIRGGKAVISGETYYFEQNEGAQTVHGGRKNLSNRMWNIKHVDDTSVTFTITSPHGENGFPGNLCIEVKYRMTEENHLRIEYQASTDRTTIFNPTNHVFFNLDGDMKNSIKHHSLQIDADEYLPLDQQNLPLLKRSVEGSDFDFRKPKKIGEGMVEDDPQIKINNGLNHPFLLNQCSPQVLLTSKDKKVSVAMTTTQSAVIIYTTGDSLANVETTMGKMGVAGAIALEAQMPPGVPPSEILIEPNETYQASTSYQFYF